MPSSVRQLDPLAPPPRLSMQQVDGILASTLDKEQELQRRRRIRILIPLALIGGVFALIVLLVGVEGGSSSTSNSDNASSSLPLPVEDLPQRCSHERVATAEGRAECQQACEPADCCKFPTSLQLSCLEGNHKVCLDYQTFCKVLDAPKPVSGGGNGQLSSTGSGIQPPVPVDGGELPPLAPLETPTVVSGDHVKVAPRTIDLICSTTALSTVEGLEFCFDTCSEADCCWRSDVPSCTSPHCTNYAICTTLQAAQHQDASIQATIEKTCPVGSMTQTQVEECAQVCEQAKCCRDALEGCPHGPDDFCDQYLNCNQLLLPHNAALLPLPPNAGPTNSNSLVIQRQQACATDETLHDCIRLCAAGRCCQANTPGNACANTDPDVDCTEFEACTTLY